MSVSLLNSPPPQAPAQGLASTPNERQPLLARSRSSNVSRPKHPETKRSFFSPNPYWVVPFWLIASFSRGMTLAPRVEVYTHLACEAYHHELRSHRHPHSSALFQPPTTSTSSNRRAYVEFPVKFPQPSPNHNHTRITNLKHGEDGEDPVITQDPKQACFTDPTVQQYAARLQMAVILIMGIMSAATTGWWSTVSDRIGRTKVMAIALLGYLFTDFMFLVINRNAKALVPFGGHKLLVLGPFVEGLLGGWTTIAAAANAYMSDVTVHGSRSGAFSTMQGLLFVGVATGPAFGSILLKWKPDILIVFASAVAISLLNIVYIGLVVPESLTDEIRQEREQKKLVAQEEHLAHLARAGAGWLAKFRATIGELLEPAALFLPRGNDWRLTCLGVAFFFGMLTVGSYPLKLLYAERMFGWKAVELGSYLTLIGSIRAIYLLVILPLIIKIFKPTHKPVDAAAEIRSRASTSAPERPSSTSSSIKSYIPTSVPISSDMAIRASIHSVTPALTLAQLPPSQLLADLKFDLALVRVSYGIDVLSSVAAAIVGSSSNAFVLATLISALGSGSMPVVQSIALCLLPNPREDSAKMLGALSMVSAIAATIVSPLLFGILYSETVKSFPAAIFVCAAAFLSVSTLALTLVRPGKPRKKKAVRRGRSTRRKVLVGSLPTDRPGTPARQSGYVSEEGSPA